MPSKSKRPPVDQWYVDLVIKAIGHCACCGKTEDEVGPLQRGHIRAKVNGGDQEPENIVPACLSCNNTYAGKKKAKKVVVPDMPFKHLPEDWRERIAGLLLQRLNPKLHVDTLPERCNALLKSKPTQNSKLIDLEASDFGLPTVVYQRSRQRALGPHEKDAIIEELVARADKCDPPPSYPTDGRVQQMRKLLDDYDRETFLRVGDYFLKKQLWITPDKRFVQDSWIQFATGFPFLLRKMLRAEAEEHAVQAKRRESIAAEERRIAQCEDERLEQDRIQLAKDVKARVNQMVAAVKGGCAEAAACEDDLKQLTANVEQVKSRKMLEDFKATLAGVVDDLETAITEHNKQTGVLF